MVEDKYEKIPDWKADLLLEKDFYSIVRKSFAVVGGNPERLLLVRAFAVTLIVASILFFFANDVFAEPSEIQQFLSNLSANLAAIYAGLLGFVLAGFAIIISLFSAEIFKALASFRKKSRGISEFKFIYFSFIFTLFVYGVGLVFSVLMLVFSAKFGLSAFLISRVPSMASFVGILLSITSVYWFAYSLLLLKSLIWNLYQLIVTSLVTSAK